MSVTHDDVRHVAALARLAFDEQSEGAMVEQLNAILGYVDMLQRADTGDIPPLAHPFADEAPMREDVARDAGLSAELLENAPERDGRFILVPPVID